MENLMGNNERGIRQISSIPEDQSRIVAVYGPLGKDIANAWYVRGVEVSRLDIVQTNQRGQSHRLCVFPGGHQQWVNEGNLIGRRRPEQFHYHHKAVQEAA